MGMLLENIKVVDLSKVYAGPLCAQILADLGADVIKVEPAGAGDDTRAFAPFQNGVSGSYVAFNRNKRSIALNLKKPEAREIVYRLVKDADVVVENYVTGLAEKLGVGYEQLKAINPRIIYASVSGYGRTGPYAKKGGYEVLGQAFGGMMSVTGPSPDAPPSKVGYSVTDITTGYMATMGVLAALIYRQNTGEGQRVDASLVNTSIGFASYLLTNYRMTEKVPRPAGTRHPSLSPYQAYRAKDGYIIIGTSNDAQWERMCSWAPLAHLKDLPEYKTMPLRRANDDALTTEIEGALKNLTVQEAGTIMDGFNIPNAPINTIQDVVENKYMHDEYMRTIDLGAAGEFLIAKTPFLLEKYTPELRLNPPQLGEHTDEILTELGYDEEAVSELKGKGVFAKA